MSVGLPKTCPFHGWAQLSSVCVWSVGSAACLLKTNTVWRQAGESRKDRNGMQALLGTLCRRAHWGLSCVMPCCRDKAKPWSMPAVNCHSSHSSFWNSIFSPCREGSDFGTWKVVMVLLKRRSNRWKSKICQLLLEVTALTNSLTLISLLILSLLSSNNRYQVYYHLINFVLSVLRKEAGKSSIGDNSNIASFNISLLGENVFRCKYKC